MKCMCSAYQKLYSSLNLINSISIDNSFFDNISFLDSFFSEFRNITFVLQKSIGDNQNEKNIYDTLQQKYLTTNTLKWLKETRNEVLKESPFDLRKNIYVDIYYIDEVKSKIHYTLNINTNDITYSELTNHIKNEFSKIKTKSPDIFFTIKYLFTDSNQKEIFELILNGIKDMNLFLTEFSNKINNNCSTCNSLKEEISKKIKNLNFKKFIFTQDGSFNTKTKKIEFANTTELIWDKDNYFTNSYTKIPLNNDNKILTGNTLEEKFKSFITSHIAIYQFQQNHIVPTFFIFYADNTYSIETVFVFNKATIYRKIYEIANRIEKENIIAIFQVFESIGYDNKNKEIYKLAYSEREKLATKTFLSFTMIKNTLEENSINFEAKKLNNKTYLIKEFKTFEQNFTNIMIEPIRKKFKEIHKSNN